MLVTTGLVATDSSFGTALLAFVAIVTPSSTSCRGVT